MPLALLPVTFPVVFATVPSQDQVGHPMKLAWVSHPARLPAAWLYGQEEPPVMEEWELALRTPDTASLIPWFLGDTRVKGSLERSSIQPVSGQRSALK